MSSWFRRGSSGKAGEMKSSTPSPLRNAKSHLGRSNTSGYHGPSTPSLTSTPRANSTRAPRGDGAVSHPSPRASPIARRHLRMDTDPQTCLEVFRSHWSQALVVMSKRDASPSLSIKRTPQEDVEAVIRYVDQMILLLVEEESQDGGQGPVLEYLLTEDILEKLLAWGSQNSEQGDQLKLHQLKMYDLMISQARQELLIHKPVIRPLMKLLGGCREHSNKDIEHFLVLILHQLCVCVTQHKHILELLFDASSDHGPAKFLVFSLLITYIHREGDVGQQARDALLLIMSLSSVHDDIGRYIANNSDFCPVLATGLSGLYSSLPRKLDYPSDDWFRVTTDDVTSMPDLIMFLNSLEFCNAVVQVAHSLVRDQLLEYIYNGFLVPVLGPALHQTSMEEVIAATAYLDLFIRRVTEPALIRTFLKFLLTAKHDDVQILESLITRISSNSRLCMVTLSLFRTMIDLNCEDVMYQLVFKYLIPCTHVMVSQRRAVKDVDLYSKTAEKLLSLRPACCTAEFSENTPEVTTAATDTGSLAGSSPPRSPSITTFHGVNASNTDSMNHSPGEKFKRFLLRRSSRSRTDSNASTTSATNTLEASSSLDNSACSPGGSTECSQFESSYLEYLQTVRSEIEHCTRACQCWSLPYDGENPPIDSVLIRTSSPPSGAVVESSPHVGASKTVQTPTENIRDDSKPAAVNGEVSDCTQRVISEGEDQDKSSPSLPGKPEPQKIAINPTTPGIHKSASSDIRTSSEPDMNPDDLPKQTAQRLSCSESVASDVDSAFSGSSAHTDTLPNSMGHSPSRTDSPLSDNFDNADFSAFLLTLKRVKTPVEFCDSIEDSFNEIDTIANELKQASITGKRHSSCKPISAAVGHSPGNTTNPTSPGLPTFVDGLSVKSDAIARPVPTIPDSDNNNCKTQKHSSKADSTLPCSDDAILQVTPESTHQVEQQSTSILRSPSPLLTPLKLTGNPNIGPFLSTLLGRLEMMMQNTLYVNLLLTGVLMRLSCFPQPLIRSFLLNHTLVFQPTVKSLIQVLGTVKQKVDCFAITVRGFEEMLAKARHFLLWREETYLHSIGETSGRRDSTASFPGALVNNRGPNPEPHREKRGAFRDFFRRGHAPVKPRPNEPRLRLLSDKQGFRYLNQKSPLGGSTETDPMTDQLEALKTKNAVYCAIVLDEFLKELAAISQEHLVTCV